MIANSPTEQWLATVVKVRCGRIRRAGGRRFPRASKQYFYFKRKSLWKIHYHSMQPVLLLHPSPHWLIRSTPKLAIAAGHQLVPATTHLSSENSSAAASTCHLSVMGIPFRLPTIYSWQATAWSLQTNKPSGYHTLSPLLPSALGISGLIVCQNILMQNT